MTTDTTVGGSSEDSEQQVTFNIKSSSDARYTLTVPLSSTVAELKQKLSAEEYASIPPERQRLIYSGRVLKDTDTISACKIKDGNTVHLVKGAESNQRQNPANQGGAASVPPGAGQAASNVPTNIAAGTGTGDPLAQLTGARYAGFHGLPGADMFGADGGMGAPPNPEQMMRMMENPNFAQQMNEALNNPTVINMLRNNPMMRDNPMAQAVLENPELRRMMFSPEMLRMQMQMSRRMGGENGGLSAFPMPGQTDTTPATDSSATGGATGNTSTQPNAGAPPANPFAALFPGAGNANLGATGTNPGEQQQDPFQSMAQQMMQNPEMMQNMMQMFGGGGGGGAGAAGGQGFNPFGMPAQPQEPADTRPPEERYESQLQQLNDMGFYDFDRNVQALRRAGGSVQGAVEYLFSNP